MSWTTVLDTDIRTSGDKVINIPSFFNNTVYAIVERSDSDHYWPLDAGDSISSNDAAKHRHVTICIIYGNGVDAFGVYDPQAAEKNGTYIETNQPELFCQYTNDTYDANVEWFVYDGGATGNDAIQLTREGKLNCYPNNIAWGVDDDDVLTSFDPSMFEKDVNNRINLIDGAVETTEGAGDNVGITHAKIDPTDGAFVDGVTVSIGDNGLQIKAPTLPTTGDNQPTATGQLYTAHGHYVGNNGSGGDDQQTVTIFDEGFEILHMTIRQNDGDNVAEIMEANGSYLVWSKTSGTLKPEWASVASDKRTVTVLDTDSLNNDAKTYYWVATGIKI